MVGNDVVAFKATLWQWQPFKLIELPSAVRCERFHHNCVRRFASPNFCTINRCYLMKLFTKFHRHLFVRYVYDSRPLYLIVRFVVERFRDFYKNRQISVLILLNSLLFIFVFLIRRGIHIWRSPSICYPVWYSACNLCTFYFNFLLQLLPRKLHFVGESSPQFLIVIRQNKCLDFFIDTTEPTFAKVTISAFPFCRKRQKNDVCPER